MRQNKTKLTYQVLCLALSDDGRHMLSGGKDRVIRVWDTHNMIEITKFKGHRDTITV